MAHLLSNNNNSQLPSLSNFNHPAIVVVPPGMGRMRWSTDCRLWLPAVIPRSNMGCNFVDNRDMFEVDLDVQQFTPQEITVKVSGKNTITVEAKHEEKQDVHGFISRQFVRRYILPEGYDINNVVPKVLSDGVLNITAPQGDGEERTVPILETGIPIKAMKEAQKKDTGASED